MFSEDFSILHPIGSRGGVPRKLFGYDPLIQDGLYTYIYDTLIKKIQFLIKIWPVNIYLDDINKNVI